MDRKKFLQQSALGIAGLTAGLPYVKGDPSYRSTYDKLAEQVGFNHIPQQKDIIQNPTSTMKMIHHKADTRGHADHGWLDSHHSFSFANYYNPERMHFGVLRVLNDDVVAPGKGFSKHPHDNMEIISIPLEGDLEHKDSMGNVTVIKEGDIQVMSAGTGVQHSEYNFNADKPVKFLQIWLFPRTKQVVPRYDQLSLTNLIKSGKFNQILSPTPDDQGAWIHQDAWFNLGSFRAGEEETYTIQKPGNGVYAFVLEGTITINGQQLGKRDGLGIWDTDMLHLSATTAANVLLMDVPMELG